MVRVLGTTVMLCWGALGEALQVQSNIDIASAEGAYARVMPVAVWVIVSRKFHVRLEAIRGSRSV